METVIEIVGVACFATIFTTFSGFIPWAQWYWTIKIPSPFNCELCMGWWLGIAYATYQTPDIIHVPEIIIFAAIAAVISMFIVKLANRF